MAIALFAFWLLLSPKYDALHITMGAFSAMAVAHYTRPLYRGTHWNVFFRFRFLKYVPWLLLQIIIANLQVAWAVFQPQMPISPRLVKFKTGLKKPIAKLALANSITLTPGTVTVDVQEDEFEVHALMESSLSALAGSEEEPGDMIRRIQSIFGARS